ncbi:MAG: ketoacyl-ACP synthase III [Deltaproteobacteria bacterium]|nr:ketoacyl-ACP synthase III [Deltaproteobacteria bacterium]
MRTRIVGTGFVTGENRVTNHDLQRMLDTTDDWIRERTGVEQRYYAEQGTTTSDLGARAAEQALADAGVPKEAVDLVIFATMTPDFYFPGCGGLLQQKLGLRTIPAIDIRQQCTGFLFGLSVADAFLKAGQAKTVLLVGAEIHSGFMPWGQWDFLFGRSAQGPTADEKALYTQFRDRAVIFGDAGAAAVLRAEPGERGLLGFALHSDGANHEDLFVNTGGMAFRPYMSEAHLREHRQMPAMNGRSVYRMAIGLLPEVIREVCAAQNVKVEEIDCFIAHQANLRINEAMMRALKLPEERMFNNIQRYGNTTAASIPLAYHEARKQGRIKPGSLVCFAGLGSGFHWGAALMRE